MLFLAPYQSCRRYKCIKSQPNIKILERRCLWKLSRGERSYLSQPVGPRVQCADGGHKEELTAPNKELMDACVVYSVAPAMGHNQVNFVALWDCSR